MIRLDEFGYCLEEYNYSFENNEVKEISYTLHNEKSQDVAVIGVYRQGNKCKRSIILWPQTNPKAEDNGYINESVEEMRLYLDEVDSRFNFENITVFTYDSAKVQLDDEFEVTITEFGKDITIYVDRYNAAVYDSALKIIKVYQMNGKEEIDYNYQIERIRITEFGVITETENGEVFVSSHNGKIRLYETKKFRSLIESLEIQTKTFCNTDGTKYWITYDSDGFVEKVKEAGNGKLYSRNEGEEQIFKNVGKVGEIKDSIYPTLVTQNYLNYKFPFMKLWTHDKLKKDKDGNLIYFERRIFVIRKCENLLDLLRADETKLKINY